MILVVRKAKGEEREANANERQATSDEYPV